MRNVLIKHLPKYRVLGSILLLLPAAQGQQTCEQIKIVHFFYYKMLWNSIT